MSTTDTIEVLLADDQPAIRTGFRFFLEAQPDIVVVGEATDGEEAVTLARTLRPDVVLLDIRMPRLDGLAVTRLLAGPGVTDPIPVVIVTTFDLDEYVYGALDAGATGFVLKNAGPTLLAEAVRAASAGDALVSPSVTVRLLRHFNPSPTRMRRPQPHSLSARELGILRLVARGSTNGEIATTLFITLSTVKSHLMNIQHKLGVRNRVEIAAWAWRNGHMSTD